MADHRPIGVLDSGLGGLTALRELIRLMPGEDFVYFGDTGRVPYGTRSAETILKFTRQDIRFLTSFDIKALVVACGTISSAVLPALEGTYGFPLIGVVGPAAEAAVKATRNGCIGLMATSASVRSGAYERALAATSERTAEGGCPCSLTSVSCPLLVPLIENGKISSHDPILQAVLTEYLEPLLAAGVDTIILGCTHYPHITEALSALAPGVTLIDAGRETALRCASRLACAPSENTGKTRFFVSDTVENFVQAAERFLGQPLQSPAERIEIEEF